jgi:hypothetical protein
MPLATTTCFGPRRPRSYSVDAKLLNAQTLGGVVDSAGRVNSGDALNAWYAAHQNDLLPGGMSVTYSTEVKRIVAVIQGASS